MVLSDKFKALIGRKKIVLPIVFFSFVLLTGFVKEAADIFAGFSLVSDTLTDINDAVLEEELVKKQISAFSDQQRDIEESLRELDYTESEIMAIIGGGGIEGGSNPLLVLRKAAQNIKRAKELIKRFKGVDKMNPDAATAAYTAMSAHSLSDIKILLSQVIYNQNRDYQDRILTRAREKKESEQTQKMLHRESVRVRAGKDPVPNNNRQNESVSGRIQNWWSGGR